MPTIEERLAGAVWGHLVGDALGVPYEFNPPDSIAEVRWGAKGTHGQPPGTWSDDGGLMLALLDSLLEVGFEVEDQGRRARAWYETPAYKPGPVFDVGITTSRALARLKAGVPAVEAGGRGESDNGNGSLMRILPVALSHPRLSASDLVDRATMASKLTHAHPRSQAACAVYVLCARKLLEGEDHVQPLPAWAIGEVRRARPDLGEELDHLGTFEGRHGGGYVLDSLWSAWDAFAQSASYRDAVEHAVKYGNDTDTTACLAGALAGLRYGLTSIPADWLDSLRGREVADPLVSALVRQWSVATNSASGPAQSPTDAASVGRDRLRFARGSVFGSQASTIAVTVNCVGVMGKGVALEARRLFPGLLETYQDLCKRSELRIGRPVLVPTSLLGPSVLLFPTKKHWRGDSHLEEILDGLDYLAQNITSWGITSLAVPALGCGNGKLQWAVVAPSLIKALVNIGVEVELYPPSLEPNRSRLVDPQLAVDESHLRAARADIPDHLVAVAISMASVGAQRPTMVRRSSWAAVSWFAWRASHVEMDGWSKRQSFDDLAKLINNGLVQVDIGTGLLQSGRCAGEYRALLTKAGVELERVEHVIGQVIREIPAPKLALAAEVDRLLLEGGGGLKGLLRQEYLRDRLPKASDKIIADVVDRLDQLALVSK